MSVVECNQTMVGFNSSPTQIPYLFPLWEFPEQCLWTLHLYSTVSPCKVNLINSDVTWSSYQVGDTRIIAGSYPCTSGCGSSLTSVCLTSGLPPIYSRVSREKLGLPMVYYRILGGPHGYPIFWTKGRNQYRTLNWLVHSQDFAFHQCVPESDSKEITNARGDHIPFRCLKAWHRPWRPCGNHTWQLLYGCAKIWDPVARVPTELA